MNTATKLHRQGQQHITDLAATVRQLWKLMCEDVGISPESTFVDMELLKTSKYLQFHDKAMNQYFDAIAQYQAGGYVGLQIKNGKAR
jgi:hypothetical protein